MNAWTVSVGLAALLTLWLVGRVLPNYISAPVASGREVEEAGTRSSSPWVSFLIALAVLAILASIGLPAYRDYVGSNAVSSSAVEVSSVRVGVAELGAASAVPQAAMHLGQAQSQVEAYARLAKVAEPEGARLAQRKEMARYLRAASDAVRNASEVEPSLAKQESYVRTLAVLATLEQKALPLDAINVTGSRLRSNWWYIGFLGFCTLFLVIVISVVIFVAHGHRKGSPALAQRWIRALLEPIVAGFVIVLGLGLMFFPEVDQTTAKSGAGLVGAGIGFWLKPGVG